MSDQRATSLEWSLAEPVERMLLAQSGLRSCNVMSSSGVSCRAGDRPALRVLSDETIGGSPFVDDRGLWPGMPLSAFYWDFYRGVCLVGAKDRNVKQYDESIGLWVRLTGDPSIDLIDDATWARFREALARRPGRGAKCISLNTVRKHLIAVDAVFKRTGPRSRDHNPQGRGLIADPPRAVKPGIVKNERIKRFTIDEISAWLAVCHTARSPKTPGIEPRQWWEGSVVLAYNTGLRLGELLKLQFLWIVEDEDGHWLELPAWAVKGGQNGRRVYLNVHARLAIRSIAGDRREILPFHHELGYVQALRRKMLAQSTIDAKRRFGFHALRKAFATELGRLSPSEAAVKMAMGHSGDVTLDFYQHRELMIEAMDKLPQPVWRPDRDGDQMLMF